MRRSESRKEAAQRILLDPKTTSRFGTGNVKTMNTTGKAELIAKEMREYGVSILGLAETRWLQSGTTRLPSGETILYSGHVHDGAHHTEGVALMLGQKAQKACLVGTWSAQGL